jgi:purine-binding chemotaxis protein CheW
MGIVDPVNQRPTGDTPGLGDPAPETRREGSQLSGVEQALLAAIPIEGLLAIEVWQAARAAPDDIRHAFALLEQRGLVRWVERTVVELTESGRSMLDHRLAGIAAPAPREAHLVHLVRSAATAAPSEPMRPDPAGEPLPGHLPASEDVPSPRPAAQAATEAVGQVLTVTIGGADYAIRVETVREVLQYRRPKARAVTRGGTVGVLNIRDELVPVFDVTPHLPGPATESTNGGLIVLDTSGGSVALAIDAINGLARSDVEGVQPMPPASSELLSGLLTIAGRIVPLLDLERLRG